MAHDPDIKKIAILGSNSFSGGHCVDYFLENTDARIIGISRSPEYPAIFLPYLYQKRRSKRFKFAQWDINKDLRQIVNLIDDVKPDLIINFVAQGNVQYSWTNPEHWFRTNCLGIVNFADHLKNKEYIKKYIQVSTPEVYGSCENFKEDLNFYNPTSPYASSKAAGDLFLLALFRNYNFPVSFVRSTNVYGIHQQLYRIIPRSIIYLRRGWKIPLHNNGEVIRSFVHIRDIVDGIFRVAVKGKSGELYHLSAKLYPIKDLVGIICNKMRVNFKDSVEFSPERNPDFIYDLDSSKAKNELEWLPKISIDQGIEEVINWIGNNWKEIMQYPLEYIHKE